MTKSPPQWVYPQEPDDDGDGDMSNLDDLGYSQEEQRLDAALNRAQIRIRDLEKTLATYSGMLAAERARADAAEAQRDDESNRANRIAADERLKKARRLLEATQHE